VSLTLPVVSDAASSDTALLPVPPPKAEPATDRLPRVTAQPVFVDATGRRLRRLRRIGALVGLACVGYLVVLAAAVGGGVVDPVTSGLPLSDAVAPLAADPAATTSTSRATARSTATTSRATAARSTAAVPAAVPTTSAAAPIPAAQATAAPTSAPATTTSAPTSTSAPATGDTETGTPQTSATGEATQEGDAS
jgi:hypothetical protein